MYVNMRDPYESDGDNPAVLERCRVAHDEDYVPAESESESVYSLLMRVAASEKPDDAIIRALVATLRSEYESSLERFTDENYAKYEKEYEADCFSEPDDDWEEDLNAECAW